MISDQLRAPLNQVQIISLLGDSYWRVSLFESIPSTQIELVAHGSGIGILIDGKTTQKAKIAELAAMGVLFKACENTIRERKIDRSTILMQAGTVPSGVAEVVLKQEAGWAYLKY